MLLDAAVGLLPFAFQLIKFALLLIEGGLERGGQGLDLASGALVEIAAVRAQRLLAEIGEHVTDALLGQTTGAQTGEHQPGDERASNDATYNSDKHNKQVHRITSCDAGCDVLMPKDGPRPYSCREIRAYDGQSLCTIALRTNQSVNVETKNRL